MAKQHFANPYYKAATLWANHLETIVDRVTPKIYNVTTREDLDAFKKAVIAETEAFIDDLKSE